MTPGILLLTAPGLGSAVLEAARQQLGNLPLAVGAFDVPAGADLDALLPAASAAMRRVESEAGVLMLTDCHGSAASLLAARLARLGTPTRRVAGLNLPMLLRLLHYPEHNLEAMQSTASLGGRNGVLLDDAR